MEFIRSFKKNKTVDQRKKQVDQLKKRGYINRVPVIVDRLEENGPTLQDNKHKYLVPKSHQFSNFIHYLKSKKQDPLRPEEALFFFTWPSQSIPSNSLLMSQVHQEYKDKDNFLYIVYMRENTFGAI